MTDIKLPPLPQGEYRLSPDSRAPTLYDEEMMEAYARAAVEADRKRGGVNSTHTLGEPECNHCGGTGDVSGEYPGIACPDCAGTGKVPQPAVLQLAVSPYLLSDIRELAAYAEGSKSPRMVRASRAASAWLEGAQLAEPVKRKRRYAQGTALGEFGIIPMCDQVDDEPVKVPSDDLAHEIWAAAQTAPGEVIEDTVERVAALLARRVHHDVLPWDSAKHQEHTKQDRHHGITED